MVVEMSEYARDSTHRDLVYYTRLTPFVHERHLIFLSVSIIGYSGEGSIETLTIRPWIQVLYPVPSSVDSVFSLSSNQVTVVNSIHTTLCYLHTIITSIPFDTLSGLLPHTLYSIMNFRMERNYLTHRSHISSVAPSVRPDRRRCYSLQ